jgi:hypothetical protein
MDKIHNIYNNYYTQKKDKTIVISVTFHENLPTIIDYFKNLLYYFRNYNLYILISCNELINSMLSKTKLPENIIIVTTRPNNLPVWGI